MATFDEKIGYVVGPQGEQGEQGETGPVAAFSIGTVSTLAAGEDATATITGTDAAPVLNLGIPQGVKGDTGATGYPTDAQVETAVEAWLEDNVDPDTGYVLDRTLTASDAAAPADLVGDLNKQISDINTALNNSVDLLQYSWVIGSLSATGAENNTSTTRIRSEFIPVTEGTIITLSGNPDCLAVHLYDESKTHKGYSAWMNSFTVPSGIEYVRMLIRKDTSDTTIISSDIETQVQRASMKYGIPKGIYIEYPSELLSLNKRFVETLHPVLEIGSISAGIPNDSSQYVRSIGFTYVNAGDTITFSPTLFKIIGAGIYKYSSDDSASYYGADGVPTLNANSAYTYTFAEDCFFKIRSSKGNYDTISASDVSNFEACIEIVHYYNYKNFESNNVVNPLNLDYTTIQAGMAGKVNIALQTDTHMSLFTNYKNDGSTSPASNFDMFASVLMGIEKLGVDAFANLGDIVRGYEFDPEYETRNSIDKIIGYYSKYIKEPKLLLIGNHDDGNMWYYATNYNEKQNVSDVFYPNEQFNRITKYGQNNGKNKNYYYYDSNGIRFIVLWQRDFDYSNAIPENNDFKIGSDQLTWLTGTALNTELPVIVMTHAPLLSSLYSHGGIGFSEALTAIQNFASNGGTVIAVLSGHTHEQNYSTTDGINHIVFKNGFTFFELISIDLVNKTITCKAINTTLANMSFTFGS